MKIARLLLALAMLSTAAFTFTACNPDGTPTDEEVAACNRNPENCGKGAVGGGCTGCIDNQNGPGPNE